MLSAAAEKLLRILGSRWSADTQGNKLIVLIYHRVLQEKDPLVPSIPDMRTFDWQMALLARNFNVLPLELALASLQEGTLPERAIAISFDDGYADNLEIAIPILKRHGLHATFFIATGYLDGGRMWNDDIIEAVRLCRERSLDLHDLGLGTLAIGSFDEKRATINSLLSSLKHRPILEREDIADAIASRSTEALPQDLMLTSKQLKHISTVGMDIGGHTVSHPILATLDQESAQQEVIEGKEGLEKLLGQEISLFAYPNGKPGSDFLARDAEIVAKAGFKAAVTTEWGCATRGVDPFLVPRFTPWDQSPVKFMARLVRRYQHKSKHKQNVD
jgi:peptidoglycan/xylan/chitin deacetylase (PgdA/CDA1 family)